MRYRKSDVTCITMCTHETCSTIRNFHTCDMACIGNSLNHIILSVKESGLNYSVKENLVALKFNFIKFKIHKNTINQEGALHVFKISRNQSERIRVRENLNKDWIVSML